MIPDIQNFLASLGLTEKERTVYIASLKHGSQTASTLAKRTDLARSTVSFVFEELIKKGFATKENQQNTTYFSIIKPEALEYIILEKQAQAKKQMRDFKDLLPMLSSLQNKFSPVPKVRYFEGVEGICRTMDACCDTDETVYYISGHNNMHPKAREYCESIYLPKASKQKNKNKMIINDGVQARDYCKQAKDVYDEVIFVDPKKNPLTLTTAIKGNRTIFMSYDPKDMSGIVIENQLIADQMRTIYKMLKESHQE